MAKRGGAGRSETDVEKMIVDFAEDLGGLLGKAQEKAKSWLSQRDQVAVTLVKIRDTASTLLDELGAEAARAGAAARRGYRKAAGRTGRAAGSTKPKKRFSASTRRKMAAAQKARWAKLRAAKSQSK